MRPAGAAFARLLLDLYLCRAATGAQLEGKVALDPRLAEDLVGKTWRAEELEPVAAWSWSRWPLTHENDGEFVVETSYLVDLESAGDLRRAPDHAGAAAERRAEGPPPGPPGGGGGRALSGAGAASDSGSGGSSGRRCACEDVDRLVAGATTDLAEVQRRLVERAAVPFGQPEVAVLFRPAMLLAPPSHGKNTDPRTPTGRSCRWTRRSGRWTGPGASSP